MSPKTIAVLGGPFPGVTSKMCVISCITYQILIGCPLFRPYIPAGNDAPIFPMAIKCFTEADAALIMKLADLTKNLHNMTATEVATIFYHGFDDNDIEVPGPFYPVCVSSHPAIYTNWYVLILRAVDSLLIPSSFRHEARSTIIGWSSPRWSRQDSLKAAVLFMIMKGRDFKPTSTDDEISVLTPIKARMPRSASPSIRGSSPVRTADKGKCM